MIINWGLVITQISLSVKYPIKKKAALIATPSMILKNFFIAPSFGKNECHEW